MGLFGGNKREQLCLIFCEDRKLDLAPMPVEKAYIMDRERREAYHLLHQLLFPMQGSEDLVLCISERDSVPLAPIRGLMSEEKRKKLADPTPIAKEEFYRQLSMVEGEERKNAIAGAVRFSVLVVAVMFAISIILGYVHL